MRFRRNHPHITSGAGFTGLCAAMLALNGCVSMHSVESEALLSAPPDFSQASPCSWTKVTVLHGHNGVLSTGWDVPHSGNWAGVLPHIAELTSTCPSPIAAPSGELSVYLMELVSTGTLVASPALALLNGFSLGAMPLPVSRNYIACVEAVSPDALRRFAVAEGNITSVANMWSAWGHGQMPAEYVHAWWQERGTKLLKELTDQAWHKFWLAQAESPGAEGCRHQLESRVGEPGPRMPSETVRPDSKMIPVEDDYVNCFADGRRRWTYRSNCD